MGPTDSLAIHRDEIVNLWKQVSGRFVGTLLGLPTLQLCVVEGDGFFDVSSDRFARGVDAPHVPVGDDTQRVAPEEIFACAPLLVAEHRKRFLEEQQESSDAVSDAVIERKLVERLEQKRDRREAATLKQRYNNACMFCGTQLQVAKDRFYSEAAHIRGLGKPDNGPDNRSNMLVLCPNHHLQFDRGVLRLHKVGAHYRIKSKMTTDPIHGKTITATHPIDDDCVKYHHDWFE